MIRISEVELVEIRMPLVEPFQISSGTQSNRRILLLRISDGSHEVWAECVATEAPTYTWETIDGAWMAIRDFVAPRVLGVEFQDPAALHPVFEKNFRGHNMAKAAVEMGAWGLAATIRGIALSQLVNGTRAKIPTGISLGIQASPDVLVEKARKAANEGYRKLKLKIKPGMDVEFVQAVRAALPDAPLMADANNAYTLDDAATLARLDEFGLMMLEQPLDWQDFVRHVELQKRLATPICLDESISNVDRAQDMITLGAGIADVATRDSGGWAQVVPLVVGAGGQGYLLKFGRSQESEADTLGVKYMTRAGYDPHGMLEVLAVLKAAAQGGQPPEFLSTHPHPQTRIETVTRLLEGPYRDTQNNPAFGTFPERFQQGAKPHLAAAPPPGAAAAVAAAPGASPWCLLCSASHDQKN